MASQPYLPLYTGDWKKDPELSMCSAATRGIWIDLLCSIHDGRIGQVTGTADQLSRLCRCDAASLTAALHELQASRAANISERSGVFTVVCRRMKKATDISRVRAEAGSKGGANKKQKEASPDTDDDIGSEGLDRVIEFAKAEGIRQTDADWFYWKGRGNGWTNGGRPILDWKATLRSWNRAGYLPSQKVGLNGKSQGKYVPPTVVKPQPEGWEKWRSEHYPDAKEKDFWRVPGDVQTEFRKQGETATA